MLSHVVVIIERESDFPGVVEVFGPYTEQEANETASTMAATLRLVRGEEVQISRIQHV
jgi:hypothetical protein